MGNIAGRWSEAWGGRPLDVSAITSCMAELKRERAARTSMRAAHPTDAKWLTLYYEDCVLDYEPCLVQIASLLGVSHFGTRQRYAFQADHANPNANPNPSPSPHPNPNVIPEHALVERGAHELPVVAAVVRRHVERLGRCGEMWGDIGEI